MTEKILSFSPYAYWQLHALYEVALCHNIQARGHSYHYVCCDGQFSVCDLFWEATVGPRPANACEVCQATVKPLLENCHIPTLWLGKFKAPGEEEQARLFVKKLKDSELLDACYKGYPVATWVKSSVHSHLRVNEISLSNAKHCETLRNSLYSGIIAIDCISRMLDELQPTILLLFNGRVAPMRIAQELAKERGIRSVCHERGMAKETLLLWENETCTALRPYSKLWNEWGTTPLNKLEVAKVTQWLIDRAHGNNLNWRAFSIQSSLNSMEGFFKVNEGKKLWTLFTSSMDEIVSEPEYSTAFGSQYRWIEETVDFVAKHPALALVIRVHPNSGGKISTGRNHDELNFFQQLKTRLPSNVALVMPDDKVSSYGLIDHSKLALVYGSTVALEAACRGVRVLLAGRTPWMYCGAIELITDADNYSQLLNAEAQRTYTPLEISTRAIAAYRFAHAYMFRWNIPFPLVQMPDIHNGRLTAKTIDELKPGNHACLDYCAEILLGIRSSIPSPTNPVRKGAVQEELKAIGLALGRLSGTAQEEPPVRVSVVITCYNYAKYLEACVASVARQSFDELELIIVNDGSTDDSLAVAQRCLREYPSLRVSIVDQPNSGQPALARNAGIRKAKGEFVLPIDADDRIDSRYLEHAFKAIDGNPKIDLVYSDSLFDDGRSLTRKIPGRYDSKALSLANQLVYCCVYRRSLWDKVGGYRDNIRGYEDWDFWLATSLTGAKAQYIPQIGLLYNDKNSGVYSQTVSHHTERTAQLILNNRSAFTSEQIRDAQTVLTALAEKNAPLPESLISVVIPCYQQAAYLQEAVDSVIAQTYPHWEIIIVNDGSPDDTSAVAQALIQNNPSLKIRLLEKQNGGLSDARNAGIRIAKGDYILPLDADDKIHPEMLEKMLRLLTRHPEISIAYCDWIYFGADSRRRNAIDYDFDRLCSKENLFTCTSLYRKSAWEAVGGYNTNMTRGVEDWDFWIGCGEKGFFGKRIPEALFYYRAKSDSMIHTLQPHLPAMFARIVLNHPKLYRAEMVEAAAKLFEEAQLPPPKPSSEGLEWFPSGVEFQKLLEEAENMVRAGQIPEAITKLEHMLDIAPNAECETHAREILQMLREHQPEATSAEPPDTESDDIFPPEEVANIEALIAAYVADPAKEEARTQLNSLQQGLLGFLVNCEQDKLEPLFQKSLGTVFRALMKCGLNTEAPTPESSEQLAILDEALGNDSDKAQRFDLRPLLARILLAPAHRGRMHVTPNRIPDWFKEAYQAYILLAPQVFTLAGESEQYQEHLLRWARTLQHLIHSAPGDQRTISYATYFAEKVNCIPLYFSQTNTREFAEKRASIIEFVLKRQGAKLDHTPQKRSGKRSKIKVGVLSAHFGEQTETHVTLSALHLDKERFELTLFALVNNPSPVEDYCRSLADAFCPLPQDLGQQVRLLREAQLDVLLIGTNVTAVTNQISLLALHRLAPVQIVNYCSPVSTGMRNVDGFLSGSLQNVPGVQEHFSEKLLFCEGAPGCLDYTVENKTEAPAIDRKRLGLGDDEVVFVNASSCLKILPEMQETWAKILKAVPKSRLVLLPFNPNWSNSFPVKQFERSLAEACARHGVARERFILADALSSRAEVKALEAVCDIHLDTFPFSGSISVVDPLQLGTPSVAWEGQTHRSRMAGSLLRVLGVPELIARDEDSYIQLAVKLAQDPAQRKMLSERILQSIEAKPLFLDPKRYAQNLGELLQTLVK